MFSTAMLLLLWRRRSQITFTNLLDKHQRSICKIVKVAGDVAAYETKLKSLAERFDSTGGKAQSGGARD